MGVVVGGVVVEPVFAVRNQAAVIGLTSIVNNSRLISRLPDLLYFV